MKLISASVLIIPVWIIVFITGYLISSSGKPYNTALFTVHKLIPVAIGVFAAVKASGLHKAGGLPAPAAITIFAAAVFLLLSIATGGIMSVQHESPRIVSRLHSLGAWLTGLSATAAMFLMRL